MLLKLLLDEAKKKIVNMILVCSSSALALVLPCCIFCPFSEFAACSTLLRNTNAIAIDFESWRHNLNTFHISSDGTKTITSIILLYPQQSIPTVCLYI